MSAQDNYSLLRSRGYAGSLYGKGPHQKDSYSVETAAGIAPGLAVSVGSSDTQAVLGSTSPVGVVIRTLDVENNTSDAIVYPQEHTISVVTSGDVLVELGNTGSKGDDIYSIDATGVIQAGTAGAGQTQLNGKLMETITAAGIARIRLLEA